METHETAATLGNAAAQGAQWLLARQQPDGSLAGASGLDDYYKAPLGLIVTGHLGEADRMLDLVAERYLQPDGDLDGSDLSWFETFRIYPHSWIVIAAMMRGRFELAHSMLRVLADFHDEKTGGFFATQAAHASRSGPQEMMSTSVAGLACLWAGRLDIARRTGGWLETVYNAQPDLTRGLYHVWDSEKGLITEYPAEEAVSYVVDTKELSQWYFQYGISAAFLSCLHGATRENEWLELAQKYLRASQHCREDVYRQPTSGKIGWGAAWTYRLSRDPADRELAEAVGAGLRALQRPDGYWGGVGVYDLETNPNPDPSLAVTGEFVTLLGFIHFALQNSRSVKE